MRFYTYQNETPQLAVALDHKLIDLASLGFSFSSMNELIEKITDTQMEEIKQKLINQEGLILDQPRLLAPILHPKQDIICLGINYHEHAIESARFKKEAFEHNRTDAIYFSKRVNEMVGHLGLIDAHQDLVHDLDYECELAVILRKDSLNLTEDNCEDAIFGYSIFNDISARQIQTKHKQWYRGKSLDTFSCMGPCIVTKDEFQFPLDLKLQSYVNEELRQNSSTGLMIHGITEVLVELSHGLTLQSGTIIATGTPAGVGMGFVPPRFLKPKDRVTCKIEGLLELTNMIK